MPDEQEIQQGEAEQQDEAVQQQDSPEISEGEDASTGDDTPDEQDGEQEEAGDEGDEQPSDVPYGVRKKLGKLTARVKERDEKLAAQQERLASMEAQLQYLQTAAQKAQSPEPIEQEPTLESCGFNEQEFKRKYKAWNEGQIQRANTERDRAKRQVVYNGKVSAFLKTHPDWMQTVGNVPQSDVMVDVIQSMDDGPAVTYYLGKHFNEAVDIANMPPHAAALALARIEHKLATKPEPVQQRNSITTAPPPVKPLNPASPIKKNLAELPMSEYVKERNKARRKSGGFL